MPDAGSNERLRLVIRDQASLRALMAKLPPFDQNPLVDFSRSEVIVVSFGTIPESGPGIVVDSVIDTPGARRIVVRRIWLASGRTSGAMVTNPIDIVVVPASPTTTIRWDENESTGMNCSGPGIIYRPGHPTS